jgi:hypothetical protein
MSKEDKTRLCKHAGCKGTQTFRPEAALRDERLGMRDAPIKKIPAWVCNRNPQHLDPDE